MDALVTNNLKSEEPDEDIKVGDNAMSVKRGASFLMGYDPYEDTSKPTPKSSIGDAPMGEKPANIPLDEEGLKLVLGGNSSGRNSSYSGDTTVAAASNLGPNPLGPNPFGADFTEFDPLKASAPAPAPKKGPVSEPEKAKEPIPEPKKAAEPVMEVKKAEAPVPAPEPKKAAEPALKVEKAEAPVPAPEAKKVAQPAEVKENPLSNIISISDGSMIIFGSAFFGNEVVSNEVIQEEEDNSVQASSVVETVEAILESNGEEEMDVPAPENMESKPLEENVADDVLGWDDEGFDPVKDDKMGLAAEKAVSEEKPVEPTPEKAVSEEKPVKESPAEKKPQASVPDGADTLMALLLAGGNPFGDNAKSSAPDLSFGKDALKPKHFEPMKASGPAANAENVQTNQPLGDNPFGKEIAPDFSFGKDALKPKKYEPKQ